MVIKEKNREECRFPVQEGDIVLIPDGAFHQVINSSHLGLFFVCIFDGVRYE